jgi:hypothetical protein
MNMGVVVAPQFAQRLIEFAISNQLKLVSPARIDGTSVYDFLEYSEQQ